MIKLCDLDPLQKCRVISVQGEGTFCRRLTELGLTEGSRVCCYAWAPGKKTAVYLTDGGLLALRRRDAELIICREGD